MKEGIIQLEEGDQTKECSIIFSFEKKGQNYIVYTDNAVDEDGFIKTYAGKYIKDENGEKLLPVKDESILAEIEKLLDKIDGEEKN